MVPVEVKVKVSNEEKALTQEFLLYEIIAVSHDNGILKDCVEKVIKAFNDQVDDVKVTIKMQW